MAVAFNTSVYEVESMEDFHIFKTNFTNLMEELTNSFKERKVKKFYKNARNI